MGTGTNCYRYLRGEVCLTATAACWVRIRASLKNQYTDDIRTEVAINKISSLGEVGGGGGARKGNKKLVKTQPP
jgi:hypothetical protein